MCVCVCVCVCVWAVSKWVFSSGQYLQQIK